MDLTKQGSLKLAPLEPVRAELRKDYELMSPMFFGEIPDWNELMNLRENLI